VSLRDRRRIVESEASNVVGLRALFALDDVVFDSVSFLERLVSIGLDRAVMHKNIGAAVTAQKAVPFCIVEPANRPFILLHFFLLTDLAIGVRSDSSSWMRGRRCRTAPGGSQAARRQHSIGAPVRRNQRGVRFIP
jgi:hypothetical protein